MTSEAQQVRWAQSLAALEDYAPGFKLELVVTGLPDGVVPLNSDGEPAIYAHPWDTDDERAIRRQATLDDPAGWCQVLIRKALDEHGDRIWHQAHMVYLERLPHDVVRRIAWAIMLGDPDPDPEVILSGEAR